MAKSKMQFPYNHGLQALERQLAKVRRSGDFYAQGAVELPMPRIEVEGVGLLSFPVPEAQIQKVIQQASRAPYGRGEATILDESVRKTWQLASELVRVGGKSWASNLERILAAVAEGMGCDANGVTAELYKLLVYDAGGFFKAHRDTEKTAGMFGTLVIVLPSGHEGGALVIRHAGREVVVDMAGADVSELRYAAFYADCEHEVKPITAGHRVCLIYNLVQLPAGNQESPLAAPVYDREAQAVSRLLQEAFEASGAPAKLAWLLEHQYSPAGLAFAGLKGADAARAKVLQRAAEQSGCVVHLGNVHLEESGPAEPAYAPSHGRGSRWRRYGDAVAESSQASSESFEIIEVSSSARFVDEWRDVAGNPVDFGRLPLADGELLPAGALDQEKPDDQRLMEATGNEGASFERSYHRAAVVIWSKARFMDVLLQAGTAASLPYLAERVAACRDCPGSGEPRASVVAMARRVVEAWETAGALDFSSGTLRKEGSRAEMLQLLADLGEVDLLRQFIERVVTERFDGTEEKALASAIAAAGPEQGGEACLELVRQNAERFPQACIVLLRRLLRTTKKSSFKQWQPAFSSVAAVLVGVLPSLERSGGTQWSPDWQRLQAAKPLDAVTVMDLLESLALLEATALGAEAVVAMARNTPVFDPVNVLVPALAGHAGPAGARAIPEDNTRELWRHAARFLLARSEQPPAAPTDWRQAITLSCKCDDCRELEAFARHAALTVHRFQTRQDRRLHLESQIQAQGLDLDCVTDVKGRPQTLVCTKTRASYQRQCDGHAADCRAMETLVGVARPAGAGDKRLLDRLDVARLRKPRSAD